MLKVTRKFEDNIAVIECSGIVQISHEVILSLHIEKCLKQEVKGILLDWSEVQYFDSMGLESLIRLYKIVSKYPGTFISVLITDPVLTDVYVTLSFDKLVPLFNNKQDALAGLKKQIEEGVSAEIE